MFKSLCLLSVVIFCAAFWYLAARLLGQALVVLERL